MKNKVNLGGQKIVFLLKTLAIGDSFERGGIAMNYCHKIMFLKISFE